MSVHREVERVYNKMEGSEDLERYHERHETASLCILTVTSPFGARRRIAPIKDQLIDRTVVEIGAGIGWLALEVAKHARAVYAIEVDPAWSWVFVEHLYRTKPTNLTWIFGDGWTVAEWMRTDVAVVSTRSGEREMLKLAQTIGRQVLNVGPTAARRTDPAARDRCGDR